MATLLLIAIYVITMGIGIPDSTLGAIWPTMSTSLNIPFGHASIITLIISLSTVIASYFSAFLIKKLGIGLITTLSTLITALALLGYSFSNSLIALCLLAVPCGVGAGAIDAAINNYVSLRYNSFLMNLTHCFYGLGVTLSPYVISLALDYFTWREGYRFTFLMQCFVLLVAFVALPLWKKVKGREETEEDFTPELLSYKQMAKKPGVIYAWLAFFSTCALEFTCGNWACTYLFSEGLSNALGAKLLMTYYIGMTAGRFLAGLLSTKISNKSVIRIGHAIVAVSVVTFLLPIPPAVKGISLFLIGLGNGPTFPNLVYLTPRLYDRKHSQSLTGSWMVLSNLGVMVMPALFGALTGALGLKIFPVFIAVLFVVMIITTNLFFAKTKNIKIRENLKEKA